MAGIGGLVVVVGSFLPWIQVQKVFGTLSSSGTDGGDGSITVVAGLVVVVAAFGIYTAAGSDDEPG